MSHTLTDEAIVLKTYDVGEADRYCVLLAKSLGRIAARAQGVRRMTSRRGASLLMFQRIEVQLSERRGQYTIVGASSLQTGNDCTSDLTAYLLAQKATELLLHVLHEGAPMVDVYFLFSEFLTCCKHRLSLGIFPAFQAKLLSALGLFPSIHSSVVHQRCFVDSSRIVYSKFWSGFVDGHDDASGIPLSRSLCSLLRTMNTLQLSSFPSCSPELIEEFICLMQHIMQYAFSPPFSSRLSDRDRSSYILTEEAPYSRRLPRGDRCRLHT